MSESRYHAFLSHHGADKPAVEELAERLQKEGINCWLDCWDLIPGEPWMPVVERALKECDCCCVFIGPNGMGPWQHEEIRAAIARRVKDTQFRVIPILLPGGRREQRSHLPTFLVEHTWVEFHESLDEEDAFHRLKCGILGIPVGMGPGAPVDPGQCPYPGLQTFQIEEAPLFFGRQVEIEWLLNKLRTNFNTPQENRFLAIVGASGSGKSSLARAGLLAAISQEQLPDSSHWPLIVCRPGYDPLKQLALALWHHPQIKEAAGDYGDLIERLANQPQRLHLTIDAALYGRPETHRAVLLIDQFEEIFTLCDNEEHRRALIDNLLEAARVRGGRTLVVITLRADFYGRCGAFPRLAAALSDHQELVGPMQPKRLRQAIAQPAQLAGCELEPGLTEMLLEGMENQPGALPLLQHALRQLWLHRSGRRLTVSAYRDIGRLEGALDRYANELFEHLSNDQREICRRIFLRLIQPGEGSEDTKRRAARSELGTDAPVDEVLNRLADARLITTSGDEPSGENFVDISHEALIRGWQRLGKWVNDNRQSIRIQQRLTAAASEWQQHERNEAYLYRGARLAEAEEWSQTEPAELNALERDFLDASIEARDQQRRKARRRTQLMALAAVVACVCAVVATVMYFQVRSAQSVTQTALDAAEDERGKAELRLARNYWNSGVLYRDQNPLKASHYFTMAASVSPTHERNARLAADWLTTGARLKAMVEHPGGLSGATLSRDESRLLTRGAGTIRILNADTGALQTEMQHDSVYAARFVADDKRVLTEHINTVKISDARTGRLVAEVEHQGHIDSAKFTRDYGRILTLCEDHAARIWDTETGEELARFSHDKEVVGAAFDRDETHVWTWSKDKTVRAWNSDAGGEDLQLKHDDEVAGLSFSPDQTRVLTWSPDQTARVWDAHTGDELARINHGHDINQAIFNRDASRVLTCGGDMTAKLWDAESGQYLRQFKHADKGSRMWARFLTEGPSLVTHDYGIFSEFARLKIWDVASGREMSQLNHDSKYFEPGRIGYLGYVFNQAENRVLTWGGDDSTVLLWDSEQNTLLSRLKHDDIVSSAAFSPDDRRILTSSWDGSARIWNATTGKELLRFNHNGQLEGVLLSRDQRRLWSYGDDGIRFWDLQAEEKVVRFEHAGPATRAQFCADDSRVLIWGNDGVASLRDAESGDELAQFPYATTAPSFDQDHRRVITLVSDGTVLLRDAHSGKLLAEVQHGEPIRGAKVSHDGNRLLTWSNDKTVKVWNAEDGRELTNFKHEYSVAGARFSWNDRRIVSWAAGDVFLKFQASPRSEGGVTRPTFAQEKAGSITVVHIWEVKTAEKLFEFRERSLFGGILDAFPTRDERIVLVRATDHSVRLFDAEKGNELATWKAEGATLSEDATLVLSWADDTATLTNINTQRELAQFNHPTHVLDGIISPAHRHVLTMSRFGNATLWDAESGRAVLRMRHEVPVHAVRPSPNWSRILTVSQDGTARLRDAATGEVVVQFRRHVRDAMFSDDGQRVLTWGDEGATLWNVTAEDAVPREHLRLSLEVRTGTRLDELGEIKALTRSEWLDRQREFNKVMAR